MRYYCLKCKAYWTDRLPRYTDWDPVRFCPEHLAAEGYRWIDAGACIKERI